MEYSAFSEQTAVAQAHPDIQERKRLRRLFRKFSAFAHFGTRQGSNQVRSTNGQDPLYRSYENVDVSARVKERFRKHDELLEQEHGGKYAERVPEPLRLGPQQYRNPEVWRPPGVEEPLTVNKQYGDVLQFLEDLDALVDQPDPPK